jgi:hypothetical protein
VSPGPYVLKEILIRSLPVLYLPVEYDNKQSEFIWKKLLNFFCHVHDRLIALSSSHLLTAVIHVTGALANWVYTADCH